MEKANTTIRQFYRDWSSEGATERQNCYDPVLADLCHAFAPVEDKAKIKVLVPGAGLGRLVFEICQLGFAVEGVEISWHMLIASSWVLNHTGPGKHFTLYPHAFNFQDNISREHQLLAVRVPDVHPSTELDRANEGQETHVSERMSYGAADFIRVYEDRQNREAFDAVATVFFLDTAPNPIRYCEAVHSCLKPEGFWFNLGPLKWHFSEGRLPSKGNHHSSGNQGSEGIEEPGAVQLTAEEMLLLVEKHGFEIIKHEIREKECGYIQNTASMSQHMYRVLHWVARKKL